METRNLLSTVYDMSHPCDVIREFTGGVPSLKARMGTGGNQVPLVIYSIGNGQLHQVELRKEAGALNCMHDQQMIADDEKYVVRRLTPVECERLQGLPDNWTAYGANGKEISDTQRYKMIGNGLAQPCVDYIMQGLADAMGEGNETDL